MVYKYSVWYDRGENELRIRRREGFVFILLVVVIVCGCSDKKEVKKEVNYNYFNSEDDNLNSKDKSSHTHDEESKESSEAFANWDKEIVEKNQAAFIEFKNLSERMEFDGTEGEFTIEVAGNSFENNKGFIEFSYLVCYDEQNQCTYYINYGVDDFVYQRKDDTTTLLISEKARYLQLWDNKLYFVNATGMFRTGDAYCYDLSSKQLTKVIIGEIGSLYVNNEGIIFSEYEINDEESAVFYMRKLKHNSSTSIDCDAYNLYEYKDYVLQANEITKEVELKNRQTGEVNQLFTFEYVTNYRVYGTYVILRELDIFLVIDLVTGKKTIYDVTQCNLPDDSFTVSDYIIRDHIMYISPSIYDYMIVIDLKTETMKYIQNTSKTNMSMDKIYFAADKMYAYLNMYREGELAFAEVIVSDQDFHFE